MKRSGEKIAQTRAFANTLRVAVLALLLASLLAACTVQSPPASAYDASVGRAWFNLSLKLIQETPGFSPPVASRALAYLGVTLYETVQPGIPNSLSLAGQLIELETMPTPAELGRYNWAVAANRALARMTKRLFPNASSENLAAIDALEIELNAEFNKRTDFFANSASIVWGENIADAVWEWAKRDGAHNSHLENYPDEYVPPVGIDKWVSTPPGYLDALQPYWGEIRPFAMLSPKDCPVEPPPAYSEEPGSEFYEQALEVYQVAKSRTPDQLAAALFWSDDAATTATTAGHWTAVLTQALGEQDATLDIAAEAYARLGIALADASISAWFTKYQHNNVRPITYIQRAIDANWNANAITDPVTTPPHPEFPSGHAVQSAAAARVLTALFGDSYMYMDYTHVELGLTPRLYGSFRAAAEEAAFSRLYGGVNFRASIENGLRQGKCVAEQAAALRFFE